MARNKRNVSLWLIFGTSAVHNLEHNKIVHTTSRGMGKATLKKFNNEGEKNAYLQGLNDMNGWQDFTTAEIEEVVHVAGGIKLKKV